MSYIDKVQVGNTVYDIRSEVDKTLTENNVPADAKTVGDLISSISGGDGLTSEIKDALLDCFEHVAWINEDGQDYYDALESALYPPIELASITCVYTQSGTVYTTDPLESLKSNLVVTAHYDDSSTQTVSAYTLSGTLITGTSTITVSYGGKTTTFTVTVTHAVTNTSPIITNYDSRLGTSGNPTSQEGCCVTDYYSILGTSLTTFIPYYNESRPYSQTVVRSYQDTTTTHYWNVTSGDDQIANNTAKTTSISASENDSNKLRFTLYTSGLAFCYCYDTDSGDIYFAGSSSPYYGMSNISEASS